MCDTVQAKRSIWLTGYLAFLAATHPKAGTALALKSKGDMSCYLTTGPKASGSQWFRVGCRGHCSHDKHNNNP